MRILLVGSLSWNPERIRSLHERGHRLFGLWARSMDWDQGPYPVLDGAVESIQPADAVRTIRSQGIECVLGLFQVYRKGMWGAARPGLEHDFGVWALLRDLLVERGRGGFDVPFAFQYGFDVGVLDLDVVSALDAHIFCNEHKLRFWSRPLADGGCGIEAFGDRSLATFLDGDRPKAEFMNERFSERLSDRDGEIHTVCIGRSVHIDLVAAAQRGIHVHIYGNDYDEVYAYLARDLEPRRARRHRALLRRHLHVHRSLQTIGLGWREVQEAKSRWVEEFSRYDAGWSYIGAPVRWHPLDDRAAIPNRLGTYLLAGLPVITERRPGWYRYDELARLGVAVELDEGGYDALRERLAAEIASREKSARARDARHGYSFDAGIPALIGALEKARRRYFARPLAERIRFEPGEGIVEPRNLRRDAGRRARDAGGPVDARPPERSPREKRRKEHRRRERVERLVAILGPAGASAGSPRARAWPAHRLLRALRRAVRAVRGAGG